MSNMIQRYDSTKSWVKPIVDTQCHFCKSKPNLFSKKSKNIKPTKNLNITSVSVNESSLDIIDSISYPPFHIHSPKKL
ncbi:hypothetical protein A3Q56_03745 [Intoshia linei]|uniref:Uncharacterized protein n=1 Tax=Intoshia linei TaxID=1819745 RepID=A0A177B3X7_9BILA|nr:hypothetical protein A3Q56_03745 [Intoshia linei]